jgi:hypothetical protein
MSLSPFVKSPFTYENERLRISLNVGVSSAVTPQRVAAFCFACVMLTIGWSWGCAFAIDSKGRTIWIADGHRNDESVSLCVRTKN